MLPAILIVGNITFASLFVMNMEQENYASLSLVPMLRPRLSTKLFYEVVMVIPGFTRLRLFANTGCIFAISGSAMPALRWVIPKLFKMKFMSTSTDSTSGCITFLNGSRRNGPLSVSEGKRMIGKASESLGEIGSR